MPSLSLEDVSNHN